VRNPASPGSHGWIADGWIADGWIAGVALALAACGGGPRAENAATSGMPPTGASAPGDDADDADGDGTGEKLDAAGATDLGIGGECPPGSGASTGESSFIWIANSPQGTVSKIDTRTAEEVARYYTGPGADDPSRTSVNLAGDVAVANRSGGIVKIAMLEERCIDGNANGTIETSSGPDDLLSFGEDECLLWHLPLPGGGDGNLQGPRPVAWDSGPAGDPCMVEDDRVWVGWFDLENNAGRFYRLDGSTGGLLDDVSVPSWDGSGESLYGPYGGATDGDGNLWVLGLSGPLARIDAATLETRTWPVPEGTSPYGLALDADGHPWTTGLAGEITHFDPADETFQVFQIGAQLRGVQIDRHGELWAAVNGGTCGVMRFDTISKTVISPVIPIDGCDTPVGVSIDVDGYVWLPDQTANAAFRFDPITGEIATTPDLRGPYTYSDMTGSGLGLVIYPPG
jgi:DNA-binding beta-propeller fold protein YncE